MPIYAYRCAACGHAKDVLQKLSDPLLVVCPACGASAFEKQVTAAGFQLKGSGWYVTDFRGDKKAAPAADADKAGAKGGDAAAAGTNGGDAAAGGDAAKNGDAGKKPDTAPSAAVATSTTPASAPAPAAPAPTGKAAD